jgi:hypothetical protein
MQSPALNPLAGKAEKIFYVMGKNGTTFLSGIAQLIFISSPKQFGISCGLTIESLDQFNIKNSPTG